MILLVTALALAQDTLPAVILASPAVYPPEAQAARITGTVVLRLAIDETGAVTEATVVRGVREDVDAAAIAAGRALRFSPATKDGAPTPAVVEYAYTFALHVGDEQGNPVPASIEVHVVDPMGLDVPGVRVVATPASGGEPRVFTTDEGGKVALPFLAPGDWALGFDKDGFAHAGAGVGLSPGETRSFELTLEPKGPMEEVVIWGLRQQWREVARAANEPVLEPITGSYTLTRRDVESTPGALEDVNRAVQKLPGVASDGDMLGTFSVHGHAPEEVVFLLDRVPLDNPYHLSGFNSIFNPDMLAEVRFFAAAAPAGFPTSTSAVMDVTSWDGAPKDDRHDLDGAVDLSMSTARLLVMGPVGKGDDLTFAIAARRSYLESYFGVMKAVGFLDRAIAAPEYDEVSARVAWRPGRHRLLLTVLRAGDHLALVDTEDEGINFIDGTLKMDNVVWLASLDHRVELGEAARLQTTASWSRDEAYFERDFGGRVENTTTRSQLFGRTDLALPAGSHVVNGGLYGLAREYVLDGPVEDTRLRPTWAALPVANFDYEQVELTTGGWRPQGAAYVEHGWTGAVRTRAGVRSTWVGATGEVLVSPSAGLSVPLPSATVPKVSAGLYHHVVEDPLVTDPVLGNADLRAERALQVVVGVDQGLPVLSGGLLRVELFAAWLDRLVVNPDVATDGPSFTNDGTGRDLGVDVLAAVRSERLNFVGTLSLLNAERTNPLNTLYATTVAPEWAQAVTAGLAAEWQATPKWRFTARYDMHTGRPTSTVEPGGEDSVVIAGLNDQQLGMFHQVDLRAEWRKATPQLRWSVYLEVLNTLNLQSDFLNTVTVQDGVMTNGRIAHLPARPFLGIRADF